MSPDTELELRRELEETKAQLDIVEAQRIQLATDYQQIVEKYELLRGVVRQVTGGLEMLRTL